MLEVSKSGYYAWITKEVSQRQIENEALKKDIQDVYKKSNRVFGSRKIKEAILKTEPGETQFQTGIS